MSTTENLWNKEGVPQKGWRNIGMTDLGEARHTCQMCDKESIRYVHHMEHPDSKRLDVGCVCAEKMEEDCKAPKAREREFINRAKRRERWTSRNWRLSKKGNRTLVVNGRRITVFRSRYEDGWLYSYDGVINRALYPTVPAAMLACFDALYPPSTLRIPQAVAT